MKAEGILDLDQYHNCPGTPLSADFFLGDEYSTMQSETAPTNGVRSPTHRGGSAPFKGFLEICIFICQIDTVVISRACYLIVYSGLHHPYYDGELQTLTD